MKNLSINTFNGVINNKSTLLISARDVHELLQVKSHFKDWIRRRLSETRFRENLDFIETLKFERVERGFFGEREIEVKEYHLTLRMAEHLCLMENNDIGDRIRDLFIEREEQARNEIPRLQAENAKLNAKLTALCPENAVRLDKNRYIELLETENNLLRQNKGQLAHPRKGQRLEESEKVEIRRLHAQGLSKAAIARQIKRSETAVFQVLRMA